MSRKSLLSRRIHSIFMLVWLVLVTMLCATLAILFRAISRSASQWIAWIWAVLLIGLGGIKLRYRGLDKLQKNGRYMFAANHSSSIDIIILYSVLPRPIGFLAKKELFKIPIFGWSLSASGHISIDRSNPRRAKGSIEKARAILRSGRTSLIFFPEGTRTRTGNLNPFKLGGFSLAIASGQPVVPVAISGAFDYLPKGSYLINPGVVTVSLADPISVSQMSRTDKTSLADKVRSEIERLLREEIAVD